MILPIIHTIKLLQISFLDCLRPAQCPLGRTQPWHTISCQCQILRMPYHFGSLFSAVIIDNMRTWYQVLMCCGVGTHIAYLARTTMLHVQFFYLKLRWKTIFFVTHLVYHSVHIPCEIVAYRNYFWTVSGRWETRYNSMSMSNGVLSSRVITKWNIPSC